MAHGINQHKYKNLSVFQRVSKHDGIWDSGGTLHTSFTSAPDPTDLSASRSRHCILGYPLNTGRVAGSDLLGGHKNILHLLRIEPRFEICALLGFHAAYNGSYTRTFRDNLSVPSSRVKQSGSYTPTFRDNLSVQFSRVKQSGSYVPTFRDNLSVPSSRVKQPKKTA